MTVKTLHAMHHAGVFYITGGGSLLLSDLLTEPGASATVLEARVPYSNASLTELLGDAPAQACSESTARQMAMHAFSKARRIRPTNDVFGFAITASLRSLDEKRGSHRAHIAMQTSDTTYSWSMQLDKGSRSRLGEERYVANVALAKILQVYGLSTFDYFTKDRIAEGSEEICALLMEKQATVGVQETVFLSGAFDPLHDGHRRMKAIAEQRLSAKVQYELCVCNADKLPLDYIEINERCAQFAPNELVLTNKPTFLEKAIALNNGRCTFVVGADTMQRIAQAKYYGDGSLEARDKAIKRMHSLEIRFLVFGRNIDGFFYSLDKIDLPPSLREICEGVSEHGFRMDISSSGIRSSDDTV